ncbi:nucleotide exchange factor GrpE [Chitinivibrio alkaliphilus]|uniref:Protein GrpE n=1 Tax=Chitinivibrio alkaliphilus ACht1 TaxID=1313304 RepID=U7DDR2_9BACT|nr:nucleotide exchange factor GrpE [Chitinivibrio alkaliphilus]ERP39036.1 GrpE protein [Chitinivibrio alkaliphilus ACht1]
MKQEDMVQDNQEKQEEHVPEEEVQESCDTAQDAEEVNESTSDQGEHDETSSEAEALKEELEAQRGKYMRLMAEFENFKRRTAQEYEKRIKTANEKLMADIIDIREDLDRALKTETESQESESFYDGIAMIYKRFTQQLEAHGLQAFGAVGDPFDPAVHDAMMKQNNDEIPEGHVVQVFSQGYKLNDVIIRHAKVIVSDGAAE